MLSRLQSLKRGQLWDQAASTIDDQFQKLVGAGADAVARLSDTALLARAIAGEATQVVRQKLFILTSLLKEAGDVAAAQDRLTESRSCYLKGLHLLLETLARGDPAEFPEFVPRVDHFLSYLGTGPLPLPTEALLMRHYELTGEFAKAEDRLFAMLDAEPENRALLDFGLQFYQRLQAKTDTALEAGNLPRAELDAGAADLRKRKQGQ